MIVYLVHFINVIFGMLFAILVIVVMLTLALSFPALVSPSHSHLYVDRFWCLVFKNLSASNSWQLEAILRQ